MLPSKTDVKLEGNLQGQKIQMGIDTTSLAHLQKILTDLYSDPIGAVVREYSTNARDAQIESGQTCPIEVTTPSAFSPFFKVKDYGVGLSVEDIKNIYSQYGASTKRGTNEQTGMLGLGCKSALTYTNQFTIVAVKDGIKSSVVVSRDADNVGAMQVVASTPTDAPNGVEISVPINRYDENEFRNKAKNFFSFWKPGQVLLNGEEPEFVKGNFLNENILITKAVNTYSGSHKLVMGGVAYNLTKDELFYNNKSSPNINHNTNVVFFVEMGEVDFTPSREELHYTARTRAKLNSLIKDFNAALDSTIIKDIDSQPTAADAISRFRIWNSMVNHMPDAKYKGEIFPDVIAFEEAYKISSWGTNQHTRKHKRERLLDIVIHEQAFIVTGKPTDKELSTGQKAKLRIWADEQHNFSNPEFFFSESDENSPWTDQVKHVNWQVILDQKLPRSTTSTQSDLYYRVGPNGREEIKAADIDAKKTILWANIGDIANERMYATWQWADQHGCEVIIVAKNKQKKFFTTFPNAVLYTDWVKKEVADYLAKLTAEDIEALGFMDNQNFQSMVLFNSDKIKDTELRRVAKLASDIKEKANDPHNKFAKLKREYYQYIAMERSVGQFNIKAPGNPAKVVDKYPLMGYIGNIYKDQVFEHIILYINAVYDAQANQTN